MANCAVSSSAQTIAIIYLIGHSYNTQSWAFCDPPGIYNPTGPNAPSQQWSAQFLLGLIELTTAEQQQVWRWL